MIILKGVGLVHTASRLAVEPNAGNPDPNGAKEMHDMNEMYKANDFEDRKGYEQLRDLTGRSSINNVLGSTGVIACVLT